MSFGYRPPSFWALSILATTFFIFYLIGPMSYFPKRLGIYPIVNIVFISYTKDYSEIWLSENMKTAELSLNAHSIDHYLILSRKSFSLNDFETEICLKVYLAMKVASFVKECLPAPPSPTSIP